MRNFNVFLSLALTLLGCSAPAVYRTPRDLAAVPCSTAGKTVVVRWQGAWSCDPTSNATADDTTVVRASGGGAWVRLLSLGWPGALDVADWYVDPADGDDANDCAAWGAATEPGGRGACATVGEVTRRLASQCDPARLSLPHIRARGDLSSESVVFAHSTCVVPTLDGARIYDAPDGTPLPSGATLNYRPWNGLSREDGLGVVTLPDGSPLDVEAYSARAGYWLEVVGGPRDGLGVPVGPARGPGTFVTSGGSLLGSYGASEPVEGDSVCVYRLTPLATAPGTSLQWSEGPMIVQGLEIGNAQHSVAVATLSGAVNGVEFDGCAVHGADVFGASWLFAYGSNFDEGLRLYGRLVTAGSTFDGIQARDDGDAELSDDTLLTTNGLWVGGRDGPGYAEVDGATCVEGAAIPALRVDDAQSVHISAPFWSVSADPSLPAAEVGPGSTVLYDPDQEPACSGCGPSPWWVGGAPFSTLPASNAGAAILEDRLAPARRPRAPRSPLHARGILR